jgi:hypothetical protein
MKYCKGLAKNLADFTEVLAPVAVAFEPKIVFALRKLESAPPVRRGRLHALVVQVNMLSDILERNWFDLSEEIRQPIRLMFYEVRDRKLNLFERLRYQYFLFRLGSDRSTLREYLDAVARLKDVLYDLLERENPRFQERFSTSVEDRRPAHLPDPAPTTAREWSAWLQDL